MDNIIKVYDEPDEGWVEVGLVKGIVVVSAHCYNAKYSRGMLRKFSEVEKLYGKITTQLTEPHLVVFFSKHYDLQWLHSDLYEIRSKSV